MKRVKLGIIGFGTVGQGFAEILANKKEQIEKNYNTEITIVGIADPVKGSVYNKKGIDLRKALEAVTKGKKIDD
ncbi:MAG TPA: homoserine dehydrogenase, partial [Candidatus Desulfofervidus auxilii]|nr:homoserine dehydrogenase [Candidatus Desulfofervidus auxilii]